MVVPNSDPRDRIVYSQTRDRFLYTQDKVHATLTILSLAVSHLGQRQAVISTSDQAIFTIYGFLLNFEYK